MGDPVRKPSPPTSAPKTSPTAATVDLNELRNRRQMCNMVLDSFKDHVDFRRDIWVINALILGSAYEDAWSNHQKVLNDRDKNNALMWQTAFAAIGMVTAGGLSLLGTTLQGTRWVKEEIGEVFANGLEDAIQSGAGSALGLAQNALSTTTPPAPIPSPMSYQADLQIILTVKHSAALAVIMYYRDLLLKLPDEAFASFDHKVFEKIKDDYIHRLDTDPRTKAPTLLAKEPLTIAIELAIWAQWCAHVLAKEKPRRSGGRFPSCSYSLLDFGNVEGQISKLGGPKTKSGGPYDFCSAGKTLIQWGRTYRPLVVFGTNSWIEKGLNAMWANRKNTAQ
jgi:hypothetical protein